MMARLPDGSPSKRLSANWARPTSCLSTSTLKSPPLAASKRAVSEPLSRSHRRQQAGTCDEARGLNCQSIVRGADLRKTELRKALSELVLAVLIDEVPPGQDQQSGAAARAARADARL